MAENTRISCIVSGHQRNAIEWIFASSPHLKRIPRCAVERPHQAWRQFGPGISPPCRSTRNFPPLFSFFPPAPDNILCPDRNGRRRTWPVWSESPDSVCRGKWPPLCYIVARNRLDCIVLAGTYSARSLKAVCAPFEAFTYGEQGRGGEETAFADITVIVPSAMPHSAATFFRCCSSRPCAAGEFWPVSPRDGHAVVDALTSDARASTTLATSPLHLVSAICRFFITRNACQEGSPGNHLRASFSLVTSVFVTTSPCEEELGGIRGSQIKSTTLIV